MSWASPRQLVIALAAVVLLHPGNSRAASGNSAGWFPSPFQCINGGLSPSLGGFSTVTLNGTDDQAAYVFLTAQTGTITSVGFRTRVVTGSVDLTVRLETVDTSTGLPTGTLCTTGSSTTQTVTTDDTWYQPTLGTACNVVRGTAYAVVIGGTGSIFTGNTAIIALGYNPSGLYTLIPYQASRLNGGVWAKQDSVNVLGNLGYSDGTYPQTGFWPYVNMVATRFNSTSSPNEIGNFITPVSEIRVLGAWASIQVTGGDWDIVLYDSDGTTAIETIAVDEDFESTDTGTGTYVYLTYFDNLQTLSAGKSYRIVARPATSSNVDLDQVTVNAADYFQGVLGGNTNVQYTSRPTGGSWTNNNTKRSCIGLITSGPSAGEARRLWRSY